MKLSELYGKAVTSTDGKTSGWVRGVLGTDGKPQFLQCFDGQEREFDIDIKDIKSIGKDIVFEDRSAVKKACGSIRLGLPAYSESGAFLGHLTEITQSHGGAQYVIGKRKYAAEYVTAGDVIIVRMPRTLKHDVTSADGAIILKKGERLTDGALKKAEDAGEYFQAQMKTI